MTVWWARCAVLLIGLFTGAAIGDTAFAQSDEIAALNQRLIELYNAGKYDEAIPYAERYAEAMKARHGPDHQIYATALNNLAALLQDTNRLSEAEQLYRRALVIDENSLGPEHPTVANLVNNLAALLQDTNQLSEAEQLYRRALAICEKSFGPEHPKVARGLNNLAGVLQASNRLSEAEPLYRHALAIDESSLGPEHPDVARDLNDLALLLQDTNRLSEAVPLMHRALAIVEKQLRPDHPIVALRLNNLARALQVGNRFSEAEPLYRRALVIAEKRFGPEHPNVATHLDNLAWVLQAGNRLSEAEPLMRRALAIFEKSLGPEHPTVATSLHGLALLLQASNRLSDAEQLYRRALVIDENSLGPEHPIVALRLNSLAALRAERGDWAEAVALGRRAKPILVGRRNLVGDDRTGISRAAVAANTGAFRAHARSLHRASAEDVDAREEGFELAQWALQTGAADALSQMSVRFAKGAGPLANLVRERQDLITRRQGELRRLDTAAGRADSKLAADARAGVSAIDKKLDAIDAHLSTEFKEYAALANPRPLSVAETQTLLQLDEALVLFLDVPQFGTLPEESLAWVITKKDVRWVKSELGTKALTERVADLRCGLDQTLWERFEGADKCRTALNASPVTETVKLEGRDMSVQILPFDLGRAHDLYKALLGSVADLIKGKRLTIVPSGPLTSLPFNVLVTEPAKVTIPGKLADYREAAWLGARTAITVLPSVASLKALREFAKTSRATKPYLGIGNPLLDGPQDDPQRDEHYKKRAQLARDKQQCPKGLAQRLALAVGRPLTGFARLFRGTQTDIEEVRQWTPLPETADELCAVGSRLGVPDSEILLGANATEAKLKELSEQGRLADYAILHFATHGALTGQVQASAEPGLILTPPSKGTSDAKALERDDGFLTASEIATLKLDADWVVLSACNTAGAQSETAEALSGMARAFFYAGARAMLVSHWEVGSDAAVKLTTRAFAELKSHPKRGRAEAFRISMRDLIENGSPTEAHPSQWAPFVMVGEGAR